MSPEQSEEYAALYALGQLEGAEKRAFEEELTKNPVTGAMVAEFENAAALLATSLPQVAAPATLKSRVLEHIQPVAPKEEPAKKFEFSPVWILWGATAALAAACIVLLANKSQLTNANTRLVEESKSLQVRIAGLNSERERLEVRANTLESEKQSLETRVATMQPPKNPLEFIKTFRMAPQGGMQADTEVIATWDAERQQGLLNLSRLPLPPPDRSYQLWIVTPDSQQPVDAGVIVSDTARYLFKPPFPVNVAALAISLEPKGGSAAPTTVVYVGKM